MPGKQEAINSIRVLNNNREGWGAAVKIFTGRVNEILAKGEEPKFDSVSIDVTFDSRNDVTNLRYVFPLVSFLSRDRGQGGLGIKRENITLAVNINDDFDSNKRRVIQFFWQYSIKEENKRVILEFRSFEVEQRRDINFSDIFGVVEYNENDTRETVKLNRRINSILLSLYKNAPYKNAPKKERLSLIKSIVTRLKLQFNTNTVSIDRDAKEVVSNKIFDALSKKIGMSKKHWEAYLNVLNKLMEKKSDGESKTNSVESRVNKLIEDINRNMMNLSGKCAASSIFDLFFDIQTLYNEIDDFLSKSENKDFLHRQNYYIRYVFAKAIDICYTVFNTIIVESFLSSIYGAANFNKFITVIALYLVEGFISANKENDTKSSNEDYLNRLIWDAESYAEGMWQAIENAQRHSCGKTAFFGMRYYKARMDSALSDMKDRISVRDALKAKYNYSIRGSQNILDKNKFSDFIEFFILDDALTVMTEKEGESEIKKIVATGIIDKIKSNPKDDIYKTNVNSEESYIKGDVDSLQKIFNLNEDDYKTECKEQYYNLHYGMRWLQRHIEKMNGVIELYSPNAQDDGGAKVFIEKRAYFNKYSIDDGKTKKEWEFLDELYATEYSILFAVPETRAHNKNDDRNRGVPKVDVDTLGIDAPSFCPVDLEYAKTPDGSRYSKRATVEKIKEALIGKDPNDKAETKRSDRLIRIDMTQPDGADLPSRSWTTEVVAKAIFSYIYGIRKGKSTEPILLAMVFESDSDDYIKEFVRLFSIFYVKQENKYMKNVQIALCSKDGESGFLKVRFLISGKDWRAAYQTGMYFLHCDAASSIEYLPLLDYLTEKTKGKKDENVPGVKGKGATAGDKAKATEKDKISIFPFDLYLED